jgi:hypothetical protein
MSFSLTLSLKIGEINYKTGYMGRSNKCKIYCDDPIVMWN